MDLAWFGEKKDGPQEKVIAKLGLGSGSIPQMNKSSAGVCSHYSWVPQLRIWLDIKILQNTRSRECSHNGALGRAHTDNTEHKSLNCKGHSDLSGQLIYSVFLYSEGTKTLHFLNFFLFSLYTNKSNI